MRLRHRKAQSRARYFDLFEAGIREQTRLRRWNRDFALRNFVAGVPPGGKFALEVENLRDLIRDSKDQRAGFNVTAEVCFIALFAYFEGFCKNQFSALVNVDPSLLADLARHDVELAIKVSDLPGLLAVSLPKIGFAIAERFRFGSAREINNAFLRLITVSPFSQSEIHRYERLLADRNLLVHHGGVYTAWYQRQRSATSSRNRAYWQSLVVRKRDASRAVFFVERLGAKIVRACHAALLKRLGGRAAKLPRATRLAIDLLIWPGDGAIGLSRLRATRHDRQRPGL